MQHSECTQFLRWALPRIGLSWPGFRRNQRQVCRRVAARVHALGLGDARAYTQYLDQNPAEWDALEALCTVTISRFYRDREVFDCLADSILPELARRAGNHRALRVWSAGCASGEEPYSLALIWQMQLAARFARVELQVLGTDRDPRLLERAARACYRESSLRELPASWIERGFHRVAGEYCLAAELRRTVVLQQQDVRRALPDAEFQLILCRNLAFSYFAASEQQKLLEALLERLRPGGCLVIGAHEQLPEGQRVLEPSAHSPWIYRKADGAN